MSKPKAPKESASQQATRLAEEERIRIAQKRADSDEAAAGRSLLSRRTRQILRMFGSPIQTGSIGLTPGTSGVISPLGPTVTTSLGGGGSSGGGRGLPFGVHL